MLINLLNEVDNVTSIVPTRNLNLTYIILDSLFIVLFLALLIWKKRYATTIFALFGGILYFIVDFGGFYAISHTRTVMIDNQVAGAGMTAAVLLWMSLSYGITNFAFIWLCLKKDKYLVFWLFMIIGWWLMCPSIAELGGEATIQTSRTTGAYHGWMAVALIIGYFGLIIYSLYKKQKLVNILWLCLIGFAVQFGWEFSLLINGIRPMNEASIRTLIVNSFLETNLGMPYIYLIYLAYSKFFTEDLKKVVIKENTELVKNESSEN